MTADFFMPLGGGNEIGANCYYLHIQGTGIILDAGMHPVKFGEDALPDFSLLKGLPVDHVIISHAHQDHIGALPFLVKNYPYIQIHSTPQTADIMRLSLHNALQLLGRQGFDKDTLYSHDEIDMMLRMVRETPIGEEFTIHGYPHSSRNEIKVTYYDAGHILGSCGVKLSFGKRTLFYTGDVNFTSQEVQLKAKFPEHYIETVITETTLGATEDELIPDWKLEKQRFAKEANKIISSGGSILIPVFAIGKTQEMLMLINNLMSSGKLVTVPVYSGGMSKKISRIYDGHFYSSRLRESNPYLREIHKRGFNDVESPRAFLRNPCIVLASSGMMMRHTMSYRFAELFLKHKHSAIFTVGYMEPSSPGAVIQSAKKGDMIRLDDGEKTKVACSIKKFRFTAHSRRSDIIGFLQDIKPSRIILTHGDDDSIDYMGKNLLSVLDGTKVHGAEKGKRIKL